MTSDAICPQGCRLFHFLSVCSHFSVNGMREEPETRRCVHAQSHSVVVALREVILYQRQAVALPCACVRVLTATHCPSAGNFMTVTERRAHVCGNSVLVSRERAHGRKQISMSGVISPSVTVHLNGRF